MRYVTVVAPMLVGAAVTVGSAAAGPAFQSPLEVPAVQSALALQGPYNALAPAGMRLVAAGQRGHILYSDDGQSWVQASVPVSCDLTALVFPTPQQGWAVGHEGVVLHSTDGGATWAMQLDGKQVADLVVQRYAGPATSDDPTAQRLRKDAELFATHGSDQPFLDVWFEDELRGFVVGAFNLILRTEDGGRSWTPWLDRVDNLKGLHLYAIRPAGGSVFMVGEQGLVLKLDRVRQRFVSVPLPYQGTLFGVTGTPDMVLVYGLRGKAFRSTDAGAHWVQVGTGVSATLTSGTVRADGSVVLASQAGQLLVSNDEGASFKRIRAGTAAPAFALAEAPNGMLAIAGVRGVRLDSVRANGQE
jgi:photosystem II stability/assembly factor-like uncharacterized protein